jgi:serine/threonine-protein kinase
MSTDLTALSARLGDRYLIEREIGRGGMGTVYLARDRRLDRPVALKVLPSEFAAVPELRERFLRETRLAAGFSHPNIVPVFAIEESDDVLAFAMGFVEGESLTARVEREGPLSRRDAVRLLQDVGYALAYAHGRGVVHRDIKPDNIMIERATSRALVMDFGIARAIVPAANADGLTRIGEVVGTPEYMSPEQATGDTVDGRADLYSLGLVAWFALSGRTAVAGESTQRILVRQLTETVPPIAVERPDLPTSLTDVVQRCCAKEPADRFQTAEALVEALDAAQLATADIPVAIRLLAVDLSSVAVRWLGALALIAVGINALVTSSDGNLFAIGLIIAGTAWVGLVNALREVRRLSAAGYRVAEIQRLLALTLAEKDEERGRRQADPLLRARRTRRVRVAGAIVLWQFVVLVALRLRAEPGAMTVITGRAGAVTIFASLMAGAAALAVLFSSPFRRSFVERVFSGVWLGPIGGRLMRWVAVREVGGASTSRAAPASAPVPTPGAAANGQPQLVAELAELRQRVDALERRGQR